MKILFLTNNFEITKPLFDWLATNEKYIFFKEEKINPLFIIENNIEFIISYNYKHIIKQDIIEMLPHKIINLHTSLLPWNRGASPNIWSFIERTPAGVTIHEVDAGLDTGDILIQKSIFFDYKTETLKSAYEKSHAIIQKLFIDNWDKIKNKQVNPKSQNGTMHYKKDSIPFEHIIDYNDTIEVFLDKFNRNCK